MLRRILLSACLLLPVVGYASAENPVAGQDYTVLKTPVQTQEPKKDPLAILIGPRGFVFQGAPKTESQLEYSLKRIAKSDPNTTVIVKCTGDSPHGLLVRALDVCNKVGLRNLSVFSM